MRLYLFFLFLIFPIFSYSSDLNFVKKIDRLINKSDPNINLGVLIRDLNSNRVVYKRNVNRHYNFASAVKLILIGGFYDLFSKKDSFSSKVLVNNKDYYIDILDPDFSIQDLEYMMQEIQLHCKSVIKGNIYIINSYFSVPSILDSRMIDDTKYCYGAPITKVHINKNCIKVTIFPNRFINQKVVLDKIEVPYDIKNNIITISNPRLEKIFTKIQNNILFIEGAISQKNSSITLLTVNNDNLNYIKLIIKKLLNKFKIDLRGEILYTKNYKSLSQIFKIEKKIIDLSYKALKESDNYILDYMLATYANNHNISDWQNAANLMKNYISKKYKVDLLNSYLVDASGLSRYNLFTPRQFDSFLQSLYHNDDFKNFKKILSYYQEYLLKDKFLTSNKIKIYAKSGTMKGISSLVGYTFSPNLGSYSFVIVSNGFIGKKEKYKKLELDIIKSLF